MLLTDIRHYPSLELPAQIQVFEPYQIGISFHFLDNRLHIGYSGEYGRYETHGTDARLIDLTHCVQTTFYAHGIVHIRTKPLVKRIDRP